MQMLICIYTDLSSRSLARTLCYTIFLWQVGLATLWDVESSLIIIIIPEARIFQPWKPLVGARRRGGKKGRHGASMYDRRPYFNFLSFSLSPSIHMVLLSYVRPSVLVHGMVICTILLQTMIYLFFWAKKLYIGTPLTLHHHHHACTLPLHNCTHTVSWDLSFVKFTTSACWAFFTLDFFPRMQVQLPIPESCHILYLMILSPLHYAHVHTNAAMCSFFYLDVRR